MYNCEVITAFGSSVGSFIGIIPGLNTGWEERTPVFLELGVTRMESLGRSDGVRVRE